MSGESIPIFMPLSTSLQPIDLRAKILDDLAREFRFDAVGGIEKTKGGERFSYVSGETVIRRLNRAVDQNGGMWSFVPSRIWFEEGAWNCMGELRITFPDGMIATRGDMGTQAHFKEYEKEESRKGCVTDCLKRCARQFGVALHTYGPDLEARAEARAERSSGQPSRPNATTTQLADPMDDIQRQFLVRIQKSQTMAQLEKIVIDIVDAKAGCDELRAAYNHRMEVFTSKQ